MNRILLLLIAVALLNGVLSAQMLRPYGVKVDLTAALQGRAGIALEWRINQKSGFEFQVDYQQHNKLPPEVFNGDLTVEYAQRSIDSTRWGSSLSLNQHEWTYLGTGRPLSAIPPSIIPLSTLHTGLGFRISYQRASSRFFLQPAINLSRHRYFETAERTFVTSDEVESWQMSSVPNELRVIQRTVQYRQSLEMRQRDRWIGGISYDIGMALQLKCGIALEGSLRAGLNFGEGPYAEPKPPSELRNFYGGAVLNVGYFFGRAKNAAMKKT